jgi:hypothetical protein
VREIGLAAIGPTQCAAAECYRVNGALRAECSFRVERG